MNRKIELSIMSPVYNAQDCVDELVVQLATVAKQITQDFEIVLVEDGSADNSWKKIQENALKHPYVHGIRLSRNFGQHLAISAGLAASKGRFVALMDCDLQDDPKYLPEMYKLAQTSDIVLTTKTHRAHGALRNVLSWTFRLFFNSLRKHRDTEVRGDIGTYSLLNRKVVNAFLQVKEHHRHYLMVLKWLGFSTAYLQIEHAKRYAGHSSYNFSKLVAHAIDGITSQSDKLLYLSVKIGFAAFVLSVTSVFYLVLSYFLYGYKEGWASVMVAILTSTSLVLMSLGVVGIYIGKIFDQAKGRPLFIIQDEVNDGN